MKVFDDVSFVAGWVVGSFGNSEQLEGLSPYAESLLVGCFIAQALDYLKQSDEVQLEKKRLIERRVNEIIEMRAQANEQ